MRKDQLLNVAWPLLLCILEGKSTEQQYWTGCLGNLTDCDSSGMVIRMKAKGARTNWILTYPSSWKTWKKAIAPTVTGKD